MTQHQKIQWRDLTELNKFEAIKETLLPAPFFLLILMFLYMNYWVPACIASFFFFITGLRLSHNAQHYTAGCSRKATEWILFILSPLMMNAMHAVQVTHLRHHKFCLEDEDTEGTCAKMPLLKSFLYGPLFTIRMHKDALKYGNKTQRAWIYKELIAEGLLIAYGLTLAPDFIRLLHWSDDTGKLSDRILLCMACS
jgi:fatty-acid desaturase